MLTNESNTSNGTNGFYSLEYFKKSLPILQRILGDSVTANTCLISEIILVCYAKNKKQLDIAHKLISQEYKIDEIVPLIRWDEKRSLEDLGVEVISGIAEFFGAPRPSPSPEREQRRQPQRPPREQRESRDRGPRVMFGTGPPPPFMTGQPPFPFPFPFPFGNTD
jgi:hypothetical protein